MVGSKRPEGGLPMSSNNVFSSTSVSPGVVISVDEVSKCYMIYDRPIDRLKQGLFRGKKNSSESSGR